MFAFVIKMSGSPILLRTCSTMKASTLFGYYHKSFRASILREKICGGGKPVLGFSGCTAERAPMSSGTGHAGGGVGYVHNRAPVDYEQGQSPEPRIREYFYYIDHQGQLFLDDARVKNFITCFKDKKFLAFFFKRLKVNNFPHYQEHFPYLSPCGVERNFVRCDDRPIVYTHILPDPSEAESPGLLSCNFTGDLVTAKFEPEKVCMLPLSGRIYHPASAKTGGVGLIKSSIAIDISPFFEFGEKGEYAPPTHFNWKGRRYELTNELLDLMTDSEKSELNLTGT